MRRAHLVLMAVVGSTVLGGLAHGVLSGGSGGEGGAEASTEHVAVAPSALPESANPFGAVAQSEMAFEEQFETQRESKISLEREGELEPSAEEANQAAEETRALTRPVIMAIRGDFGSAEERRDAMLAALQASGASEEAWTASAPSTLAGFRHALGAFSGVEIHAAHTRCFRAGCEATVHFSSTETYLRAAEAFRHLREEEPSHGGRVQTPGVQLPDGRVEANWIVLRPSAS